MGSLGLLQMALKAGVFGGPQSQSFWCVAEEGTHHAERGLVPRTQAQVLPLPLLKGEGG